MTGIYKITNKTNGKVYVGQAKNIFDRWSQHARGKGSKPLFEDMQKIGINNFTFEIIEFCPTDDLDKRETFWIKQLKAFPNGYNLNSGGSIGNEQAIKVTSKPVYCYDLKGEFLNSFPSVSEAARQLNLSDSNICRAIKTNGRTENFQWRYVYYKKIGAYARKCFTGKQSTENNNNTRKVSQFSKDGTLLKTFGSISEAASATGANKTAICNICQTKGKCGRKTSGGYIWRYEGDKI